MVSNGNFNHSDSDQAQIFPMPRERREDAVRMLQQKIEQRSGMQTADTNASIFQPSLSSVNNKRPILSAPTNNNNKLVNAASPLLVLIAHISNTIDARDTYQLRQQISQEVGQFKRQARQENIDNETIQDANYILCTVLDEAILHTPWGRQSDWGSNTLLNTHFQDIRGGNVFFEKLKQISDCPAQSIQLLKLMYYCLALGFQGRYRHEPDSIGKLNYIKAYIADKIWDIENNGNDEHLSPHWIGITGLGNTLKDSIPAWLIGTLVVSLLLGVFSSLLFLLSNNTNQVITDFESIAFNKAVASEEPIFVPKEEPTPPLSNDGSMEITEGSDTTTITISGDLLFSSGSATVSKALLPTLSRLATELNSRPGQIEITGHSDNIPITNARLKSLYPAGNYDLSQTRADNVGLALKQYLNDPGRMSTRGVGSESPIADNSSKVGRKKNRRVEIVIFH